MSKVNLLIIEDEVAIRDMLLFALPSAEFTIFEADTVKTAIQVLEEQKPDVIILDWMLPGRDGIAFIKWIKQQPYLKDIPIIMLTAKAEEESKIKGLDAGADDYVTKPFSPTELVARIKAILRRGPLLAPEGSIEIGQLLLDLDKKTLIIQGKQVSLTAIEYKLMEFFMKHPNRPYSRDQLISHVWGMNVYIDERTVDVRMRRLRDKLKEQGCERVLTTVRGVGYQFVVDADDTEG